MAKKNKKKEKDTSAMDIMPMDTTSIQAPEAMDTSEVVAKNPSVHDINRKAKGVQMKRSKNVRKLKAVAKAIAKGEKAEEKVSRRKGKTQRILSAKSLY